MSKIEGSDFKICKLSKFSFLCDWIYIICKSSENLSFTLNRFQQAEITLLFVPTSILAFSYTIAFMCSKHSVLLFRCNIFFL